ncbi:shikimate kinase [uncultured Dysosmobacter sp.]|uniref:shikimate kinase n=1 Tax=uncultured Dysosmobacter sp. TaxID=2591384 RepID=UPI00261A8691|nr:shikimate kinase [uncultured Dysosmobacter sp.]
MAEKVYGLLGRKLGHSWSVPIHAALGCGGYRLIELEPEQLGPFLARQDIGGLNVTIPYKRDVMPYCDVIDEAAQAIGSVNTLARRADGKLYAWNTDAAGFCWMARRAGVELSGRKVVILGSGGASLTAQAMARRLGAREVVVISRSGENNYGNLERHADAEIVVNTTPVGMYPNNGAAPVDLAAFPRCQGVLDVIYNPRRTALLLQAESLGIPCSDGLPMLVAQAKAAEEHFFDRSIPDSENARILSMLRRDSANIVLIGMPGCGKTTVGQALAALTGREAIDIDARIVSRAGCSIPQIFAQGGETSFRALEREETAEAGKLSGKIILTGGGVVKDARNYGPLHQNGRIYHLIRDLNALPTEGRPLSQGADLSAMWAERAPLYARFRDTAVENRGTVAETAAMIWRDFCENSGT